MLLSKEEKYRVANEVEEEFMNVFWHELEFATHTAKGIISHGRNIHVLPDIQDLNFWIELKCKNRRVYYNDTGFSERLFNEYCGVQKLTKKPVIIAFKNTGKQALLEQSQLKENDAIMQNALYGEYGICTNFVDKQGNPDWYGGYLCDLELARKQNKVTNQVAKNNGETNVYFPLKVMRPISVVLKELQKQLCIY